jgi:hypothetical protein
LIFNGLSLLVVIVEFKRLKFSDQGNLNFSNFN